ncbi:MAG: hypothetical protein MUC48_27595, partial [Leptolyngbya sp. Prado105]|nr:hypothetical protein [Leptolyngbya sp. Prado105]
MTLTAINSKLELFNPSALIEQGDDPADVAFSSRESMKDGLFCPHCYQRLGKLHEVRYRHTSSRRVHFYHPKYEAESRDCKNHSGESEKHLSAKAAIARRLEIDGLTNIKIEARIELLDPALTFRKPDILLTYPNGVMEAHEIQISPITSDELARRTQGLKQHGCGSVVWYLAGKNYSEENRRWCHANNVKYFRLWFEDSDPAMARWEAGKPPQSAQQRKSGSSTDQCSTKPTLKRKTPQTPVSYTGKFFRYSGSSDVLKKQYVDMALEVLTD